MKKTRDELYQQMKNDLGLEDWYNHLPDFINDIIERLLDAGWKL